MKSYPHKNNLICLSEIKDWYNLVPDYRNNTISVDERYFQSVRPGYQIDIKKLHCILKTNFYHYYILIDFPIKSISDNEITNTITTYINLLEMANTGLLKVYNNYFYYKHPDAHLLKELNLKNSIIINNYKNEYQNSELPHHSKTISKYFKKSSNYLDKEINNEFKYNMQSLFDFSRNAIFGISKLETIEEPKNTNNSNITHSFNYSNSDEKLIENISVNQDEDSDIDEEVCEMIVN